MHLKVHGIGDAESRIHPRSHFDPAMPDLASYKAGINVNVIGSVLGMKHGIAALRKRGGGSITLASSNGGGFPRGGCAGDLGDLTFATPYCLTSAALDQMVRMSAYYKNENIRVYGLKAGVYASEMIDQWVEHFKKVADPDTTAETVAGFNFFFSGLLGDSKHIGKIYEVRPYPNRNPRAYYPTHIDPHVTRLGCGVFRIASHPPSQPATNTCT